MKAQRCACGGGVGRKLKAEDAWIPGRLQLRGALSPKRKGTGTNAGEDVSGKGTSWGTGRGRWGSPQLSLGTLGIKKVPESGASVPSPPSAGAWGRLSHGRPRFAAVACVSAAGEGPWPGAAVSRGAQRRGVPLELRGASTHVLQPSPEPAHTQPHVARGARLVARAPSAPEARPRPSPCSPSSPPCLLGEGGRRRRPVPQFQSPSPAQLQPPPPPPPSRSPKEKGTRASSGVPAPVFPRNHEP